MFGSNGLSAADVAAVVRNNDGCCNNGGYGMMNGIGGYGFGEIWWVIIILMALFGGFGYGGFGYGGAGMRGGNGCGCEAAVATVGDIQRGFDNQGVTNKLNGLENGLADGFYAMNNSMLTGFNGVQSAIQNSAMNAMQNTFTLQQAIQSDTVANMQNTNALATQLANCCCENRTGFQQVGYNLATQGNAIQVAIANQTQALMQNQNDNYRALHEEIVANRMEDMKTENANLRSQIQALNLAASQANQNTYLVNTLRPCPQPAYVVANPFCCNQQVSYQNANCCPSQCCG